jgi:hypothetical protein
VFVKGILFGFARPMPSKLGDFAALIGAAVNDVFDGDVALDFCVTSEAIYAFL